ncbi:MAG TPA: alpha/beta hydrolase [Verrucomicrobiae bacterium]|nr:alpha/beta hydrolase [Verrucomicrobiae bacterium]
MKTIAYFRLVLALMLLPALGSPAQPVLTNAPAALETLPADSPYGEATVKRNIPYVSHPTTNQNFDLYLPRKHGVRPFPLVIWMHGGAWLTGSKEWDNVKYLVQHGYAIASIDYRYSPEAPFPAQIQDCNAAMNFILAHAADYGVDARRFVVGGGSAGGHLALLLGLARQEREFGANPAIKPLAILDFFGPTDLNGMAADLEAIHAQRGIATWQDAGPKLLGAPLDQAAARAKAASPITYVSAAAPPVLILQGDEDDLVPVAQSQRLHVALNRAGVDNELIMVHKAGHDGPMFSAPRIQPGIIDFLNGVFKNAGRP